MILGVAIVSDVSSVKRMFGREPVDTESEEAVDSSSGHKLNRYVTSSLHSGLLSEPSNNYRYIRNNSVIMAIADKTLFISKSDAVHVNVSKDVLPNYDIHIFYYPWYGNPTYDGVYLHWNHPLLPHWKPDISARYPIGQRHQPPDDLGSSFYPRLGAYSSRDPLVIEDHMRQIQQSGAGYLTIMTITWVNFLLHMSLHVCNFYLYLSTGWVTHLVTKALDW